MNANFKTTLFGGFDRTDVVNFIQQLSQENQQRVSTLEAENQDLWERNHAMETELGTLRRLMLENGTAVETCRQLRQELEQLQQEHRQLCQEAETLRRQADEYQSLKDHIAEIEISAHRRTEEFRTQAIRQLGEMAQRQQDWCDQAQNRYQELSRQFAQKLLQAQQALEDPDMEGFEEMRLSLRQLQDSFSGDAQED